MWKLLNKSRLCYDGEKARTLLVPFFNIYKETVSLNKKIHRGSVCPELIACFELRTEHENLHRNKAKNKVLNPITDQQLRRVVSKCSVWW